MNDDPLDATQFRYREDHRHNRDMLEFQAEKAFLEGAHNTAALFAIAGGLQGLIAAVGAIYDVLQE